MERIPRWIDLWGVFMSPWGRYLVVVVVVAFKLCLFFLIQSWHMNVLDHQWNYDEIKEGGEALLSITFPARDSGGWSLEGLILCHWLAKN